MRGKRREADRFVQSCRSGEDFKQGAGWERFWMLKYVCYTDVASRLGGCRCCTTAESHCGKEGFQGGKNTQNHPLI